MSTKKASPKPKAETPSEPVNTAESETDFLKRRVGELEQDAFKRATEVAVLRVEKSTDRNNIKALLETNVRLLTALIADADALKVYREQALADARQRLAKHDQKSGEDISSAIWSAFKWEPAESR